MGKEKITKLPGAAKEEKNSPKMISVEEAQAQLQAVVKQAQGRMQQMGMQINNLESMLRDKTIDNLFKVLEYSHNFNTEFVEKCASVIESYLTKMALEEPKAPEAEEKKEEAETKKD